MPDTLLEAVKYRTRLTQRYRDHAAPESMQAFLDDWIETRAYLDERIHTLTRLHEQRDKARRDGRWPPSARAEAADTTNPERP